MRVISKKGESAISPVVYYVIGVIVLVLVIGLIWLLKDKAAQWIEYFKGLRF